MKAISSGAANTAQLHLPAPDPGSRQPPAPRGRPAPRGTARPRHAPKAVPPPTGASSSLRPAPAALVRGSSSTHSSNPLPTGEAGRDPPQTQWLRSPRSVMGSRRPVLERGLPCAAGCAGQSAPSIPTQQRSLFHCLCCAYVYGCRFDQRDRTPRRLSASGSPVCRRKGSLGQPRAGCPSWGSRASPHMLLP